MLELGRFLYGSVLLLCISLGSLLFVVAVSEIPLGSKLTVEENNSWVSSNGDFAVGFYNRPDQPNQFSVGIRFNSKSIPVDNQTVVWVAGAEVAVSNNSYFQLQENGELVLFDATQSQEVWSSKTSQSSIALAFLRDDGNLVLLNEEKDVVWQSFDNPTDTLLPGQRLSTFRTLRAASQNDVSSLYSLYMNISGQLQLKWESSIIYWQTGRPSHSNLSAVLTSYGSVQLVARNLEPVWSVFGEDHNDTVKFRFLRLDVDGNLRLYSWIEVSQTWRAVWQAVENQCRVFATCHRQGICVFDASGSPVCTCPFRRTAQSNPQCLVSSQHVCKSGSIMVEHANVFLYGFYPVNDSISLTSLDECKSMCITDSSCTAATFTNDGSAKCRMMKTQYVTGYADPSLSSMSFVKSCSDPLAADPTFPLKSQPQAHKESYKMCIPCLVGAASGTMFIFVMIQVGLSFYLCKRRNSYRRLASLAYSKFDPGSKCLIMLSFNEIKDLTGNFSNQIGPKMFKGTLPNNLPVAVKKLEATIEARKFRAAVSKVGCIYHKGLVKLEGYCCELDHRYLVYEYAKNGSVEKYVEDSTLAERLTWRKRIEICLSVGRAISYLHTECREFLCHGNLKCENVVLDENSEAKVNEFGFGMLYGEASSHRASAQKDVEDFGKMVLTLITGFKEVNDDVLEWAYKEWMDDRPENVVDKRLDDEVDGEELERALRIAFWCLQRDERVKPSMGEVVKVLEGTLPVDTPPPPFTCWRSPREDEESSELGSDA